MPSLTLPAIATRAALAAVITSASTDDGRPVLHAVRLRVTRGPRVRLDAADNYRIATAEITGELAKHGAVPESTVIDLRSAKALLNALPAKPPKYGAMPPLVIAWQRNGTLTATYDGSGITLEVVDGQYPNIDSIQPKGRVVAELVVDAKLLASVALAMGSLSSTQLTGGVIAIRTRTTKPPTGYADAAKVAYEIVPRGVGPLTHALLMPTTVRS